MSQDQLRVVLMTGPRPVFDYPNTVLGRPFIQLERPASIRLAFDSVCRELPKLVITEQALTEGPATFLLERLAEGLQTRRPPVLLLTNLTNTDAGISMPLQPRVLRIPTPVDRFDSVVMELLGYKPRHARRHPIRLHFKEAGTGGAMIGSSISISSSGALVETLKKLAPGLRLRVEVMGIPELKGLDFPGVVLREEPPPAGASAQAKFYAVQYENPDPYNVQQLVAYLSAQDTP